jgi:hypothetical protein
MNAITKPTTTPLQQESKTRMSARETGLSKIQNADFTSGANRKACGFDRAAR